MPASLHDTFSLKHFPAHKVTRALGWFSIGLGVAELLIPRTVGRTVGLRGTRGLMRAHGAREIATGIGLLAAARPAPWLWGRVAGDALDMAALGTRLGQPARHGMRSGRRPALALGAVAAVAALDLCCARAQRNGGHRPAGPPPDYSARSGFPRPVADMRGAARDDFAAHALRGPAPPTVPGAAPRVL